MTTRKHEHIHIKLTIEDKRTIKNVLPNGELSEVTRCLLLMYASDERLRERVRQYRQQGWQEP